MSQVTDTEKIQDLKNRGLIKEIEVDYVQDRLRINQDDPDLRQAAELMAKRTGRPVGQEYNVLWALLRAKELGWQVSVTDAPGGQVEVRFLP